MELGPDDIFPVLDHFNDAVRSTSCDSQSGSGFADRVKMEGAAPDLVFSKNAGNMGALKKKDRML